MFRDNKLKMKKVYGLSFLWIIIDQTLKMFANKLLIDITLINNFLYITKVKNYGVAFGLLDNVKYIIIAISILILVFINNELMKEDKTKINVIIYSFVIGGLLGNLIDRIFRGYVVDYISVNIFGYGFPVFNFADILITIGFILYGISIVMKEKKDETSR